MVDNGVQHTVSVSDPSRAVLVRTLHADFRDWKSWKPHDSEATIYAMTAMSLMKNLRYLHLAMHGVPDPMRDAIKQDRWSGCFAMVTSFTLVIVSSALWRLGLDTLHLPQLSALCLVCTPPQFEETTASCLEPHLIPFIDKHAGKIHSLKTEFQDATWNALSLLFLSLPRFPLLTDFAFFGKMKSNDWAVLREIWLKSHEAGLNELKLSGELSDESLTLPTLQSEPFAAKQLTSLKLMFKFLMTPELSQWLNTLLPQLRVLFLPNTDVERVILGALGTNMEEGRPQYGLEELFISSDLPPAELLPAIAKLFPLLKILKLSYNCEIDKIDPFIDWAAAVSSHRVTMPFT
jgi:hypothetical protein